MQSPPADLTKTILKEAADSKCRTRADLARLARRHLKHTPYAFPTSLKFWEAYRALLEEGFENNEVIERILRVKDVRTDSGVAPITVLTKPFPCPGRCVYCPSETRMPKSYISTEPAAARALSLEFDPYQQVKQRILTLEKNGHKANKIELIVKGGTWSAYTADYREWFITRCFEAANELLHPEVDAGGGLEKAQKINETADYRIIGLTIETRPDWVKPKEVIHLRKLGVTRVELGLQIINDRVLDLVKRGTTVSDAENAIHLLKTAGFKVDVHMLPGMPGATTEDDLESFRILFADPRFRPDMVKIYPCVVLPDSELAEWTARGEFKPIEGQELLELLVKMQSMVPRYCRVPRVIRDFPTTQIAYGNKKSNLREILDDEMIKRGLRCVCLRCREVGHVSGDHTKDKTTVFEERYENAGGTEVFLSVENEDRSAVFAFLRMRQPPESIPDSEIYEAFPVLRGAAIIRELHTYGTALNIDQQDPMAAQHKGYGRMLMKKSEELAAGAGFDHMAVISGIGVREYYRQLGYEEKDSYMVKSLNLG
ncbi:MAG: tRNA uridine(34) 5-carboxymethylaminomethyl modification radical SAM/GNAT enzyme Elp3 [Patescibacteria group bacterium]|nr:tRNA uridine(34) 5-carboxymethylaminomethyl modification radical SAM/GNAT enzyme Elp3 [Patescibacteria group bacterium]